MEVVEHAFEDAVWTLVLRPEAGEPMEIRYRIADGLRLPIEPAEQLWFNQTADAEGLVVSDVNGALRVFVAVDSRESFDGTLHPSFEADRLIYTDTVALPSGCMSVIDHHALEVTQDGQRSYVVPGEVARVSVPVSEAAGTTKLPFDLYVFDVSRPAPRRNEADARCPTLANVSWMLVSAR